MKILTSRRNTNLLLFLAVLVIYVFSACATTAISAEEFFAIGMAYFDLGRYEDAEKWLNRARQANRTMTASSYNLGRIAFETGRFEDAARYFEGILKRDPDNVLALRAAAFTRIKTREFDKAEKHYSRLLSLVPESADDGYNHALVLFAMERYDDAIEVIEAYPFALQESRDALLLLARIQRAMNNVEAIESYSKWLSNNTDARVRYEFAQTLEEHEYFARAIEEYRSILSDSSLSGNVPPTRGDTHFALGRLLLTADPASGDGITEIEAAIENNYNDIDSIDELLNIPRISTSNRDALRNIVNNLQRASEAALEAETKEAEALAHEQEWQEMFDFDWHDWGQTEPEPETD